MELLKKAEFVNANKDKVTITLFKDSAGGFHVIVGSERVRKQEEQRVIGGKLTAITTNCWHKESKVIQLPTYGSALNEFHLYRFLESEPGFTINEYSTWQKATNSGESV